MSIISFPNNIHSNSFLILILVAGGFPDDEPIAERTLNRFHYPFRGCLQDVFVNSDVSATTGTHLDLAKLEGQNIGICDLDDNFVKMEWQRCM